MKVPAPLLARHAVRLAVRLAVLLAACPLAAQDSALTFSKVQGAVHVIVGRGGNIGLSVGDDGLLMVDSKFADLAEPIRAAFSGFQDGELSFLLNTHYHGDHTGGNAAFGVEAPIVAHANVRARLMQERRRGDRVTPGAPKEALPVVTFEDAVAVHFNGERIEVVHFPAAHTDGDAVVFFTGSDVVHMGDIFFHGRFPYVDLDAGGSVQGMIDAVAAVLVRTSPDTKIIPGHGELTTITHLAQYMFMMKETLAAVRAGVEAGHSLEQLQAAGLGSQWADWGSGFISEERWIATLHRSVTE